MLVVTIESQNPHPCTSQTLRHKSGPPTSFSTSSSLYQALVQHRVGHFHETSNVGAIDQVAGRAVFLGRFVAVPMDGDHDFVQLVLHFLAGPGKWGAFLRHFET